MQSNFNTVKNHKFRSKDELEELANKKFSSYQNKKQNKVQFAQQRDSKRNYNEQ